MAKKNENKKVVAKAKKQAEQATNDIETQETQTQTDNGEGNETETSSVSTESTDSGASGEQTTSEENTQVDTPTENEGDASEGNQNGSEVDEPAKSNLAERIETIGKDVFSKSTAQVLYFTEDLIPFFNESDARKHASEIDAPLVYQYKREQ